MVLFDHAGWLCGDLLEEEFRGCEEVGVFRLQIPRSHPAVFGVDVNPDTVAARSEGRNHRRARTAKGIEHGVARE